MKKINFCFLAISTSFNIAQAAEYSFVGVKGFVDQKIAKVFLTGVYNTLNIKTDIQFLPTKRAAHETNSGLKDGEIMRTYSYGDKFPNVIRVPTAYYEVKTKAFIKHDSSIIIKTKEDLKQYRIAIIRGVIHSEKIAEGAKSIHRFNDTKTLLNFIQRGRADIGLTNEIDGIVELTKRYIENIMPIETPIATNKLYHYLHKDHLALVPKVDSLLNEMKANGELNRLIEAAENKVLNEMLDEDY